ncbi:hypothetical protein BO82DRAFT_140534 [Aspergillus uvarum CBS 121591]|uniref:Uncharacterized protein n=1 Tax=Aspergillus uvarum CBS 121591 TaxID=1448315 RepID=A0A319CN71_9EURO|nr:hypothetical protein BO82DRAFT_140534 [Aspergillus uvarum CBS 121591]PYH85859.1 hypothetical protein BO82DRAFT_140534 [Aspergillus uvarum CBS 121591]
MDPPARSDRTETIGTLPAGSREIPHKTAKLLSFQCHSSPPQNGARLLAHCGPAGLGVLGMSTVNSRQLQLTELGGFSGRCQPPLSSPVRSRQASKQPRSMDFWRTPNFPNFLASHLLVESSPSRREIRGEFFVCSYHCWGRGIAKVKLTPVPTALSGAILADPAESRGPGLDFVLNSVSQESMRPGAPSTARDLVD